MQPEYFLAGLLVATSLVFALAADGLRRAGEHLGRRLVARRNRLARIDSLPAVARRSIMAEKKRGGFLDAWTSNTKKQIDRAGWKMKPAQLLIISALLICFGAPLIYALSRDLFMTFALALFLIFVPFLYLNRSIQKHYYKINEQLPTAIQLFTVEFEITKNITESLMRCAKGTEAPLNKYVEQCARELSASRNPRDAFQRFANNLGCEYGKLWAQMLLAATEDSAAVKIMPRLITRLSGQRLLQQKNLKDLAGVKRVGTVLNILILPAFLLILANFPEALDFYTQPLGKMVIIIALLSVPVGALLDQMLRKVDA